MSTLRNSFLTAAGLGVMVLGGAGSASAGWFSHGSSGGSHGSSGGSWGSSGGSHGSSGGSWGSSGGSHGMRRSHGSWGSSGGSHGSSGGSHGSSGGSWGSSGGSYGSSGGSWGSSYGSYGGGEVAQAAPVATDTRLAYLNVQVPADAVVYLQDQLMTMTGENRRFVTPAIDDGKAHIYTLKVVAQRNGQPVSKTTQVTVNAGQEVKVVVTFDVKSPTDLVASITPLSGR